MNVVPRFNSTKDGDVERHTETDEVFLLIHGCSILFIAPEDEIQAFNIEPCVVYIVTKNTWHSVLGTKEITWLIVKSNDTSSENTVHRQLSEAELDALMKQYPS